jgi:hypothetical protein
MSKRRYIRNLRFAVPGFLLGLMTSVDIAGNLAPSEKDIYQNASSPVETDLKALAGDAATVSRDFQTAFDKVGQRRKTIRRTGN